MGQQESLFDPNARECSLRCGAARYRSGPKAPLDFSSAQKAHLLLVHALRAHRAAPGAAGSTETAELLAGNLCLSMAALMPGEESPQASNSVRTELVRGSEWNERFELHYPGHAAPPKLRLKLALWRAASGADDAGKLELVGSATVDLADVWTRKGNGEVLSVALAAPPGAQQSDGAGAGDGPVGEVLLHVIGLQDADRELATMLRITDLIEVQFTEISSPHPEDATVHVGWSSSALGDLCRGVPGYVRLWIDADTQADDRLFFALNSLNDELRASLPASRLIEGPGEERLSIGAVTLRVKWGALLPRRSVETRAVAQLLTLVDRNNDRTITVDELGSIIGVLDINVDTPVALQVFNEFARTRKGALTYSEVRCFLNALLIGRAKIAVDMDATQIAARVLSFLAYADTVMSVVAPSAARATEIVYVDRRDGARHRERVPRYVQIARQAMRLRQAAGTDAVGAALAGFSREFGRLRFDKKESAAELPAFVRAFGIDLAQYEARPLSSYRSFNEFFARRFRPEARPVFEPLDAGVAVCPVDGRVLVFPAIDEAARLFVKGEEVFDLATLLGGDAAAAALYAGGSMLVGRLTPGDYHWFHVPVAGTMQHQREVGRGLDSTHPIALFQEEALRGGGQDGAPAAVAAAAAGEPHVFCRNKRVVQELYSPEFGCVAVVAVGSVMEGSVHVTLEEGEKVAKGTPHGLFQYGGSTVILLFQPKRIVFDNDLVQSSRDGVETFVPVNSRIGLSAAKAAAKKQPQPQPQPQPQASGEAKEGAEPGAEPGAAASGEGGGPAQSQSLETAAATHFQSLVTPELMDFVRRPPAEQRALREKEYAALTAEERAWEFHRFRLDLSLAEARRQLELLHARLKEPQLQGFDIDDFMRGVEESYLRLDVDRNGLLDREELSMFVWTTHGYDPRDKPEQLPGDLAFEVETVLMAAGNKGYFTFWDFVNMRIPPPFNRYYAVRAPPATEENFHPTRRLPPLSLRFQSKRSLNNRLLQRTLSRSATASKVVAAEPHKPAAAAKRGGDAAESVNYEYLMSKASQQAAARKAPGEGDDADPG
jgi:phosphatidylserine decarboxylase/Ca2+-binding EF-hand superfamily protein